MDIYSSLSNPPDCFRIDDLLDFSNYHFTAASTDTHHLPPPQQHPLTHQFSDDPNLFTNFPSIPSDEAAELEWLSQFVDDTTSFHDFPLNQAMGSQTSSFLTSNNNNKNTKASNVPSSSSVAGKSRLKRDENGGSPAATRDGGVRRCSHCASEKTPQWRTGPSGPKTLCNACGVRFKSGRLVPEYRPASSPTFVLTQHSNSHRKVMELRRQKELRRQQHDFKVC